MDYRGYKAQYTSYIAKVIHSAVCKYFKKKNQIIQKERNFLQENEMSFDPNGIFDITGKEYEELYKLYEESLMILTERQRAVLELTKKGCSDTKIAEFLGMSASTARNTRQQARKKCKKYIEDRRK